MVGRKWPNAPRKIFQVSAARQGKCPTAVALSWKSQWAMINRVTEKQFYFPWVSSRRVRIFHALMPGAAQHLMIHLWAHLTGLGC